MRTYVVKQGDTLSNIAIQLCGDWMRYPEIARVNGIEDVNLIKVDQVLQVPGWWPVRAVWPVRVRETAYYRFGSIYRSGRWQGRLHPGVDWHVREGAGVRAVGPGVVRVQGYEANGYGFYTVLEHRMRIAQYRPVRAWSLYAHMVKAGPPVGTVVEGGEPIGLEGVSGAAGTPHLHFELKKSADLGLYGRLDEETLQAWYWDPQVVLDRAWMQPVWCWACPGQEWET